MAEDQRARATTKADDDGRAADADDAPASSSSSPTPTDLWCSGPLLRAVQRLALYGDSKHFVDMPLLSSREEVMRDFEALVVASSSSENNGGGDGGDLSPLPPRESLLSLVERHFAPPGTELEAFEPPDFSRTPRDFLPRVGSAPSAAGRAGEEGDEGEEEDGVRAFALRVHRLWPQLCRRQRRRKEEEAPFSSSLLGTEGWSVVPGERFRESYYWDSYWSIRGCLSSRMPRTATAVVATLCELAGRGSGKEASLVPNGARSYYLGRSQPPLLADAAAALFLGCSSSSDDDEDAAAARKLALDVALPAAKAEHAAWCRWPRTVRVELDGKTASFARYFPHSAPGPRPEAWREDTELSESLSSEEHKKVLWLALAAAAESGWDFSTRWLAGGVAGGGEKRERREDGEEEKEEEEDGGSGDDKVKTKIKTPSPPPNPRLGLAHLVVPVDLNVFLARAEAALSTLCLAAGQKDEARRFASLASERIRNIDELFWDPRARSWADLGLLSSSAKKPGEEDGEGSIVFRAERRNAGRYASSWSPLWARRRVAEAAKAAAEAEAADGGEPPSPPPSPFSELDLQAVSSLLSSGLIGPGGLVSASLERDSKEQWDGDNAWPPLQAIVAEGCADAAAVASTSFASSAAESEAASKLSERIVRALVLNVKNGLERDGCVREKYKSGDSANRGIPGEGGEYETQVGFGWSNGAVLCLLRRFGWPPSAKGAAEAGEVGD